jgi:formylglycine-generating enzyme required for sulfatase activity
MSAFVRISSIVFLFTAFGFSAISHAEDLKSKRVGMSATKPATGPSVQVDDGYMVPYTLQVPGSEVSLEMIPIAGGVVTMGSPDDEEGHQADEGPQIKVKIGPMWVAKNETTWKEYKLYMSMYRLFKSLANAGLRKANATNAADAVTAPTELYDRTFTFEFGEEDNLPATTMTQYSAKQYTKWLSKLTGQQYRLPTEAEWEYACRAGSEGPYSFGNDASEIDEYAWHTGNSDAVPHEVGQKKPNKFGLHDMHGNVMEWTVNGYSAEGYKYATDKKQPMSILESVFWPDSAENRVVRGGSFQDDALLLRSAAKVASKDEDWKSEDPNVPLSPWWFTSDPARGVGFRVFRPYQSLDAETMKKFWETDHEYIDMDVRARIDEGRGVSTVVDQELSKDIEKSR